MPACGVGGAERSPARLARRQEKAAAKQAPTVAKPCSYTGMASFLGGLGEGKGGVTHISQNLVSLS